MTPLRRRMTEELQLRNYSAATIDSYLKTVWRFTKHHHKSPELLGPEDVRQFLLYLRNDKRRTPNTLQVNQTTGQILRDTGFGMISKTAGTSRQIQFSLKLIY